MFEELKEILVDKLKIEDVAVTPESTLEEIDLDSLSLVELAMIFESQYGVRLSDDELAGAETVGAMARLVEEHRARV